MIQGSRDNHSSNLYANLNNQVKLKSTNGFGSARVTQNNKPTGVKLNSFRGGPVKATMGAFEQLVENQSRTSGVKNITQFSQQRPMSSKPLNKGSFNDNSDKKNEDGSQIIGPLTQIMASNGNRPGTAGYRPSSPGVIKPMKTTSDIL